MISYNPKDWFTFIFRFHKSDTVRQLFPMMVALMVYSYAIAFIEMEYLKLQEDHELKSLSVLHSMLTFVISMMLVFRTNSAYDRWWEGRKLWGALINNSRNLSLKLHSILPQEATTERHFFATTIAGYAEMLKRHLQNDLSSDGIPDHEEFNPKEIKHPKHRPNVVASLLFNKVFALRRAGKISENDMLLINAELQSFSDICGACERIKNSPIPYSYSVFLKKFIFFFVMTLPISLVFTLGYLVVPVVAFIFYAFASLELIAEEIEDPFGKDDNDLPMTRLCEVIRTNSSDILFVTFGNDK